MTQKDTITLRALKFACFAALRAGLAAAPALPTTPAPPADGVARVTALLQALFASEFMSDRAFAFTQLLELGGPAAAAAQVRS